MGCALQRAHEVPWSLTSLPTPPAYPVKVSKPLLCSDKLRLHADTSNAELPWDQARRISLRRGRARGASSFPPLNQSGPRPDAACLAQYDRQWMIVDAATHRFLTARTIPRMLLIHPSINRDADSLDITVPSSASTSPPLTFSVPLAHPATYLSDPEGDESLDHDYSVFGCEPQDGYSVGSPELIAALSDFMGRDVLLIRKGLTKRSVKEVPGVVHSEGLNPVLGFADFYAFQIASATSLKCAPPFYITFAPSDPRAPRSELTTRIHSLTTDPSFNQTRWSPSALSTQGGLEITRFRPNIVVEGLKEAWEEDGWKRVRFAEEEEVEVGMKCGRCQVRPTSLFLTLRAGLTVIRHARSRPTTPPPAYGTNSSPTA